MGAYAFDGKLDQWNPKSMVNASGMFNEATKFNSCLSTWADKVNVGGLSDDYMFLDSGCPVQKTPTEKPGGPWCQGQKQNCKAKTATVCEGVAGQKNAYRKTGWTVVSRPETKLQGEDRNGMRRGSRAEKRLPKNRVDRGVKARNKIARRRPQRYAKG